jgi:hypothetical protein
MFMLLSAATLSGCGSKEQTAELPKNVEECRHQDNSPVEVGISDYQVCVGELANRSQPADRKLCAEAGSTMTLEGRCQLSE